MNQYQDIELGNLLFGNSRGEYPIPRNEGFEEELWRLFEALAKADGQEPDAYIPYGTNFENNTFWLMLYWWGECNCGAGDDADEHQSTCGLVRDNLHHKPSGFGLQWYKFPLRDSYSNRPITPKEFSTLIDECIESLGGG